MRRVKIVCTLGPSTAGVPRLLELIQAGMDVARVNFSHGEAEGHRKMVADLREASRQACKPIAIIGDLSGPKIRIGKLPGGAVPLEPGKLLRLVYGEATSDPTVLPHSYAPLARDVRPGEPILLDDGLLELTVDGVDGDAVRVKVKVGGTLKDHKGMNLPGSALTTPALTDKDKRDIGLAKELGVDFLALSFVRAPADMLEAKQLAGKELPVIAKIEKPEAVAHLDEILAVADGAMVARGDLGVELGHEKVPLVQKRILGNPLVRDKPTITATQMLDSMINNPRPTRAEVSDVANAVLDGTDAVMTSGETSVGKWPVETVRTMAAIIDEIEASKFFAHSLVALPELDEKTYSNAIAHAAVEASARLGCRALAVYTESGRSARLCSGHRPVAAVIAFSRNEKVLRQLALSWGVKPLHGDWVHGVDGVVKQAERRLLEEKLVQPGDDIVVTFGMVLADEPFQTNIMKLWRVRGA
jgi:pyruvate kinase